MGSTATPNRGADESIGGPTITFGPAGNAPAASPAGNPPQSILVGPDPVRSAQNSMPKGDLGGSFVGLGLPLGWSSDAATAPAAAPPSSEPAADAPAAWHHSSIVNAAGTRSAGKSAVIAWDGGQISALDGSLATGSSGASQDWLDDFINHLGQNEAVWNPNAGIRVRPTMAAAGS